MAGTQFRIETSICGLLDPAPRDNDRHKFLRSQDLRFRVRLKLHHQPFIDFTALGGTGVPLVSGLARTSMQSFRGVLGTRKRFLDAEVRWFFCKVLIEKQWVRVWQPNGVTVMHTPDH